MHGNVHALGMFLRFAPKDSPATAFYRDTVKLPLIRTVGDHVAEIFWAGEAVVFEIVFVKDKAPAPEASPETAACLPVFRVHDLDGLLADLGRAGVTVTAATRRGAGREAFLRDPDGYWMGLRERDPQSSLPSDAEARRRHRRGETFNPGCAPMPPRIQELGWVVRRVADVTAMTAFYRDVLELPQIGAEDGRPWFDLGDNGVLELAPGGTAKPPPADRYQATAAFIVRVSDIVRLRKLLADRKAHVVNERIPLHWAELMYFADPEGSVIGAEQGHHPGVYAPEKFVLPENLEAERRWREHVARLEGRL